MWGVPGGVYQGEYVVDFGGRILLGRLTGVKGLKRVKSPKGLKGLNGVKGLEGPRILMEPVRLLGRQQWLEGCWLGSVPPCG